MRNIAVRLASAIPLAILLVGSSIWCSALFDILVCAGGVAGWLEWYKILYARPESAPHRIIAIAGLLYLLPAAISLIALQHDFGWPAVLLLFAIVWSTDTLAFLCGRLIGGPRLMPSISPNKTWAGAIGGIGGGVAASLLTHHWLGFVPIFMTGVTGLLLSALTQIGDLLESAAKRYFQVKDSGWLIPGHGGILDRIDGLLLAAPFFAACRFLIG